MNYQTIVLEKKETIATITLNRPKRLNALGGGTIPELLSAIADVDDEMRVLVITGEGWEFCSGRDEGRRSEGERECPARGADETRRGLTRGATRLITGFQKIEKPTIAMVNGGCCRG